MLGAAAFAQKHESAAQGRVGGRGLEEGLAQGAQVEARAADEERRAAARLNLVNRGERVARPVGGGVGALGRDEIYEVVRDAAPLVRRDFRRGDLDLSVDLYRVAVDDLAARAQRERDAEVALARGGRADDGDDGSLGFYFCARREGGKRRKATTSQMSISTASAPRSCARENRIVELPPENI